MTSYKDREARAAQELIRITEAVGSAMTMAWEQGLWAAAIEVTLRDYEAMFWALREKSDIEGRTWSAEGLRFYDTPIHLCRMWHGQSYLVAHLRGSDPLVTRRLFPVGPREYDKVLEREKQR